MRIVRLNERGETVLGGECAEIAEFVLFEERDDEENRIGAGRGRFENMIFRDGEIFPQDGQCARSAGGTKIVQAALEEIVVGQDGERRSTAVLVLFRERDGVEIGDEHSLARRGLFDLGDNSGMTGPHDGCKIAAAMSRLFSSLPELADWNRGFAQLFSFAGRNPGQDVGCGGNQDLMVSQANVAHLDVRFRLAVMYRLWYRCMVTATITQFRKELFQLADQALGGEPVAFTHRGVVFQVVPEKKTSKLNKLVGQPVLAANVDLEQASKELSAEMEAAWLEDWSDL
jgi:hypothetical protein